MFTPGLFRKAWLRAIKPAELVKPAFTTLAWWLGRYSDYCGATSIAGCNPALVLAAIGDRSLCRLFLTGGLALGLDCQSYFLGANQRFANVSVFRIVVERNQPIAVRAVRLKPVSDSLCTLAKSLRALRAFDSDLFVDHATPHEFNKRSLRSQA